MPNLDAVISNRIFSFLADLDLLLKESALAAVRDALRGTGSVARATVNEKPRSPKKAPSKRPKSKPGGTVSASSNKASAAAEKFLAYVRANPGERGEIIANTLGVHANDFRKTLNSWLASGVLKKRGAKRATRYWAGDRSK